MQAKNNNMKYSNGTASPYNIPLLTRGESLARSDRGWSEAGGSGEPTANPNFLEFCKFLKNQIRVTHIGLNSNGSRNVKYHTELIKYVNNKTDCPIVINTSFNVRGEPIVATPLDAYRCFMRTEMDDLFMGSFHIIKTNQPKSIIKNDFFEEFELD